MELSIDIFAAFFIGVLSFFSPCNFALIPTYLAYIGGGALTIDSQSKKRRYELLITSLFFVFGFMFVFLLIGGSASALSQFLTVNKDILRVGSGVFIILLGILFVTNLSTKLFKRDYHIASPKRGRYGEHVHSFLIGCALSFGWSPCYGPLIGAVLTLTLSSETFFEGLMLFFVYSLGFALPFILLTFFMDSALNNIKRIKPYLRHFNIISGLLLIMIGVIILFDRIGIFTSFVYTIFDRFNIPYTS